MSNHSGGHMLNEVLELLDNEFSFFKGKDNREIATILDKFVSIGLGQDCNSYEILDGVAAKYSICDCCGLAVKEFDEDSFGTCSYCYSGRDDSKYDSIVIGEDEVELVTKVDNDRYWTTNYYKYVYKNGEYTTKFYSSKDEAIVELQRYLNGELL